MRDWLLERGELPDEPLVALVPVSVRTEEEQGTFGNKVTGMILPIPTDVADPRERLMRAHEILKRAKEQAQGAAGDLMTDVSNFLPPAIFSRASRARAGGHRPHAAGAEPRHLQRAGPAGAALLRRRAAAMPGNAESLNVASAAAICLYQSAHAHKRPFQRE